MDTNPETTSQSPADQAFERHFAEALDAHRGLARRAFLEAPRRSIGRRLLWPALAAAACVAFGIGMWLGSDVSQVLDTPGLADDRPRPQQRAAEESHKFQTLEFDPAQLRPITPVAREQVWQTHDAGTFVLDGQPVRAVQRREWETVRFRNGAGFEVVIERPREQWVLIDTPVH